LASKTKKKLQKLREITLSKGIASIPMPFGFVKRQLPGRRGLFTKPKILPQIYLSRYGHIRKKKHKRKNRKTSLIRFTDLV
jgi:hypothetical protein